MTKANKAQAMDEQYGGQYESASPAPGLTARGFGVAKTSSAYCLVYVRDAMWSEIMVDVTNTDIAQHAHMARLEVTTFTITLIRPAYTVLTVQCNSCASTWRHDLHACRYKLRMLHCKQTPSA